MKARRNRIVQSMTAAVVLALTEWAGAQPVTFTTDAVIQNGDIYEFVIASNSVAATPITIDMTGGFVNNMDLFGYSNLNLLGGHVHYLHAGAHNTVEVNGGTFDEMLIHGQSIINIRGGAINATINNEGDQLVNVYGSQFRYDLPRGRFGLGILTGILADGSPFRLTYTFGDTADVHLVLDPPVPPVVIDGSLLIEQGDGYDTIDMIGNANVTMTGGTVISGHLRDNAAFRMSGGYASDIIADDTAQVHYDGGFISRWILNGSTHGLHTNGSVSRVEVHDSASLDVTPATLREAIDDLRLFGNGRANIVMGRVEDITLNDSSTVTMRGGRVDADVTLFGQSGLTMIGSRITDELRLYANAQATIDGSRFGDVITLADSSRMVVHGSTLARGVELNGNAQTEWFGVIATGATFINGDARLTIHSADLSTRVLWLQNRAFADIRSGVITGGIELNNQSTLHMSGGHVFGRIVTLGANASLTLTGYDFNVTANTISGFWAHGQPFSMTMNTAATGWQNRVTYNHVAPPLDFDPGSGGLIVDGQTYRNVNVMADAFLAMFGGNIYNLNVDQAGGAHISGGTVHGDIDVAGQLQLQGGLTHGVSATGQGLVQVSGGDHRQVYAGNEAAVHVSGGNIYGGLYLFDNAAAHISDGAIMDLSADHHTTIDVTGGIVVRDTDTFGYARLNVSGGLLNNVTLYDNSRMVIHGGKADDVETYGTASIHMIGGLIDDSVGLYDNASMTMRGGEVEDDVLVTSQSRFTMTGGRITDLVTTSTGVADVAGGELRGQFYYYGQSRINFYGLGFDIIPGGGLDGRQLLTGTWADGSNFSVEYGDMVGSTGTLRLHTVDYNNDQQFTAGDIDAFRAAITAPAAPYDANLDLNHDGQLSKSDTDVLVSLVANTYYGDVNLNRTVGIEDLSRLAAFFGTTSGAGWGDGDVDGDGDIDITDLSLLAASFGSSSAVAGGSAAGGQVPLPGAGVMAVVMLAGIGRRRLR